MIHHYFAPINMYVCIYFKQVGSPVGIVCPYNRLALL